MYKLVAIDIDGTLLNSNQEVTERTRKAIKTVLEQGIHVVLTSGRISKAVQVFSKEIGANQFLIAENGASIIDLKSEQVIYSNYIPKERALKILDLCMENGIYYMIYTNKELIVKNLQHMALFFYCQSYHYHQEEKMETHLAEREYVEILKDPITKMMICDQDRMVYDSIVNKLEKIVGIEVTKIPHVSSKVLDFGTEKRSLEYSYAEIAAKGANKWSAIQELIKKLEIESNEVVAIGDNINDISMIKGAGLGVAMGNSSPYVKEVADKITFTNDEDGVAQILEDYILKDA